MAEGVLEEAAGSAGAGPLSEIAEIAVDLVVQSLPRDFQWPFLPISIALALTIWLVSGGRAAKGADGRVRKASLGAFLLPRDIYTHVSARVDVGLYFVEHLLRPLWIAAFLALAPLTEAAVMRLLDGVFALRPLLEPHMGWMLLYSLFTLLFYDFFFFLVHYAGHRVPALWAIHKVHHSAEVLTPLTRYREHILEGPMYAASASLAYGLAGGIFGWLFSGGLVQATLFNMGFFAFLFGFTGAFRHYHVALHYPRWLSRWLHSPVMHHVHHSYLPQHIDRNFAAVTSIWDRLAGTLYIPERDEYTPWGLGPAEQPQCRGLMQNILAPLSDWKRMLRSARVRSA